MSAPVATQEAQGTVVKMAQCIESNDLFSSIVEKPLGTITGGVWGLVDWLVIIAVIGLAVWGLIKVISRKKASQDISALGIVLMIPFVAIVTIAVYNGMKVALTNIC